MDLSTVHQNVHKRRRKKRVGRGIGSGHGKTATRGSKGQWASAGANMPTPVFEGGQMPLFRRIPKRGFSHRTWRAHYAVVNVGALNDAFSEGATVDHAALRLAGLAKGPAEGVRLLGEGELNKRLVVRVHHVSKSAREKIVAKGGTIDLIAPPARPKRNKMRPRLKRVIHE
jgi:large subunit ribosomal protein L15